MEVINSLFGTGKDLTALQMGCRAFVMFFIALALIRISGMRAFGIKSAFDTCVIIMLGAVLSRAITGASAFLPTTVAGVVLIAVHKILAVVSVNNQTLSHLIKGYPISLYKEGVLNSRNLRKSSLSYGDIMEEIRRELKVNNLDEVEEIIMERNGKISIIKKRSESDSK